MTDAIQKAREALRGQLALLHSLANDTTEANWRDKRLYILQTCVRMSDALAALDAETPATPADVGEEPAARYRKLERELSNTKNTDLRADIKDDIIGVAAELATALEQVTRERDEARANAEIVCNSYADENQRLHDRATSAEAKLAEARKVIEPFAEASREFNFAIGPDGIDDGITVIASTVVRDREATLSTSDFSAARRFLEETK